MDRNQILIEFWELTEVNNAISKMKPIELQEDLKKNNGCHPSGIAISFAEIAPLD